MDAADVKELAKEFYRSSPMVAWKSKVRTDTRSLILNGLLLHPGCCEECGIAATEERIHIHHNSYLVPDDISFLCQPCHVQWHKTNEDPPQPSEEWVEAWQKDKDNYPYEEVEPCLNEEQATAIIFRKRQSQSI